MSEHFCAQTEAQGEKGEENLCSDRARIIIKWQVD